MGGRVAGHALVKQGRHLGVVREVVEEARAMHMVERGLAGAHCAAGGPRAASAIR
jgi:hypothetical protein